MRSVRADFPLVIATNRDEFFARPSSGAQRLLELPSTVGGRDLRAGGTWMGVTRDGLFVGLTNHRSLEGGTDLALRSRGELVLHALSLGNSADITRYVQSLDGRNYNSFNLMWGDAHALRVGYGRSSEHEVSIAEVPPGIHVLPNDKLDSPDFVKVQRAQQLLGKSALSDRESLIEALKRTLSDRQLPQLQDIPNPKSTSGLTSPMLRELAALCVRTPLYGTRSSTIVLLEPRKIDTFLYADGPPDQAEFRDVLPLYDASVQT